MAHRTKELIFEKANDKEKTIRTFQPTCKRSPTIPFTPMALGRKALNDKKFN
jgi:hypothetical protein